MCVWVRGNGHKNRLYACVYACAYVAVVLTGAKASYAYAYAYASVASEDRALWTSLCNGFLVSVLSLFFSAASCMNPDKNNLLYFNKQAAYLGYLWHSLASPIMILPVLLNAWC